MLWITVIFQFDDSDVGVDDIYNTVEVETSDTGGGYKAQKRAIKDDDNIIVSDQEATSDEELLVTPCVTSSVAPSVTINDSVNNQGITLSCIITEAAKWVSQCYAYLGFLQSLWNLSELITKIFAKESQACKVLENS